ncbi:MAG: DinB family protein [Flavobacteriales bacterium]|nr:DinB family protein [Flavobacteriales bacterium]
MQQQFNILSATRKNVLNTINSLSLEQLNTIPMGFKNNIVWNASHIMVTQQLLCYKLSGLEMYIDNAFVDLFKKGSEASYVTEKDIKSIKENLISLPSKLEEDYNGSIFKNYTEYPTSYGVMLKSIEDAIQFNNVHEGLHFGYIMAMKKLIHN